VSAGAVANNFIDTTGCRTMNRIFIYLFSALTTLLGSAFLLLSLLIGLIGSGLAFLRLPRDGRSSDIVSAKQLE
jgi:hypothetical protein